MRERKKIEEEVNELCSETAGQQLEDVLRLNQDTKAIVNELVSIQGLSRITIELLLDIREVCRT
jgi:hypothetical protein